MNSTIKRVARGLALVVVIGGVGGCGSYEDPLGSSGGGSFYYGVGFQDPWYYGGYYDDPDIIVAPPVDRPDWSGRPNRPVARPLPSIPSTPRVSGRR